MPGSFMNLLGRLRQRLARQAWKSERSATEVRMRIHFVRTGGFAGMRLSNTIDSEELPEEEVHALVSELDSAHFFELPSFLSGEMGGADRFQYEITVEDGSQKHTVAAGESSLPGNVQPLVEHLERLARTTRH